MFSTKIINVLRRKNPKRNVHAMSTILCHRSVFTGKKLNKSQGQDLDQQYTPFSELHQLRRKEAKRSVLIQTKKTNNHEEIQKHCLNYGHINNVFLNSLDSSKHYTLVEFSSSQSAADMVKDARFFPSDEGNFVVPHQSRLLYLKFKKEGNSTSAESKQCTDTRVTPITVTNKLNLQTGSTLEEQMRHLYLSQQMTEFSSRMRYFVCSLLEDMFSLVFNNCQIMPFGSSVSGFGKFDCDLDMIFETGVKQSKLNNRNEVLFKTKKFAEEREFHQQTLDLFAKLLLHLMPGCFNVRRILHARIPIIKFDHLDTALQCDLTIGNRSGVYMSELFHVLGSLDNRVRPLVFTVRHWARSCGVTHSDPGTWITNYQLTLLVLYSLQTLHQPVLPSVEQMKKLAGPGDKSVINGQDFTFLKDFRKIPSSKNQTDLGVLLRSFFKLYAYFNFKNNGISLIKANTLSKPEDFPMYLQNPLEPGLNTSKNVNEEQLDMFQQRCAEALDVLNDPSNKKGLTGLFDKALESNSWTESEEGSIFSSLFTVDNETTEQQDLEKKPECEEGR